MHPTSHAIGEMSHGIPIPNFTVLPPASPEQRTARRQIMLERSQALLSQLGSRPATSRKARGQAAAIESTLGRPFDDWLQEKVHGPLRAALIELDRQR